MCFAWSLIYSMQYLQTCTHVIRLWRGEFGPTPPFDIGQDTLFVAYSAWAEMTCFLQLGWQFPVHILDLHTAYLSVSNILLASRSRRREAAQETTQTLAGRMPRLWHRGLGERRQGQHRRGHRRVAIGASTAVRLFSITARKTFA